jgi:hypothetical protein
VHHRPRDTSCQEPRAVRYTVLEKAERAGIEVEQHAHTITLLITACFVVATLAIAVEPPFSGRDEPTVSTVEILSVGIEVGPRTNG